VEYLDLWADGIHINIRLVEHKLCRMVGRGRPSNDPAPICGCLR
jgi:hypothetical protein